jgi:hypothetical protein
MYSHNRPVFPNNHQENCKDRVGRGKRLALLVNIRMLLVTGGVETNLGPKGEEDKTVQILSQVKN